MIITNRSIPRRTVLRGVGATLALPLLDAMVPAIVRAQSTTSRPRRFSVVYLPNGMAMQYWTPKTEGVLELTPVLQPLAAFRDRVTVVSGLNHEQGNAVAGEGTGDHARATPVFLSGVHPKKTAGSDIRAGVTADQIVAARFASETQFASLELGLDSIESAGACDGDYSCAYVNTISWRTPTTPNPVEVNPRVVFDRLFGEGELSTAARLERLKADRSILDGLREAASRFQRSLGAGDQKKLSEYLEAIRDIERRIQLAEKQSTFELPVTDRPVGVPDTFEEHARLMFDLQVLAFRADLTRMTTFMLGREVSNRAYPQLGVPEAHHGLSHHQDDPVRIERLSRINTHHAKMFASYLEKLQSTPDGEGTLLDRTVVLYGASISNSNWHLHDNLPLLVAGGGLKGGRHLNYRNKPPMTNLLITLLQRVGVQAEKIGDSTGTFAELSEV